MKLTGFIAELAPLAEESSLGIEMLDSVVELIRDKDVPGRVDGDPKGMIESPISRPAIAEAPQEVAVQVEHRHPVVPQLGHVQSGSVRRDRQVRGSPELARPGAAAAHHHQGYV